MSHKKSHIHHKVKRLRKKTSLLKHPVFWVIGLVIIIVATAFYFVVLSSEFQVLKINIAGNQKVASPDLQNVVLSDVTTKIFTVGFLHLWSKSIFFINTNNIARDILKKFPEIESVKVQKELPQSIVVNIQERQPYATFCQQSLSGTSDTCFPLDKNGIIFDAAGQSPQEAMIIKVPASDKEVFMGESVVNKNLMDMVSRIEENLKNNFQVDIKEAFISNPLVLTTSENWQINFDPTADIDLQITKMNALLKDQISINARKKLQYIYLQYQDRAYYK